MNILATPILRLLICVPLLVLGLVATSACGQNQLTASLDLTVSAAEITVPIIAQFVGVDPVLAKQLNGYIASVGNATDKSITIMNNKALSDAQRAEQITATFASAIAQSALIKNALKGAPAQVTAAIDAVIHAVEAFMNQLALLNAQVSSTPAFAQGFVHQTGPTHMKVDGKKLAKIQYRAKKLAALK